MSYAAASACSLRATSVWLECTSAEQALCASYRWAWALFLSRSGCLVALAVPDFTLRRGFYLRPMVQCVLNLLRSVAAALRFWSLSCLAEGVCGRCLHTVIGLCGPHPRPLLLAMLCSLCGLVMLCLLRGLSDWNPAHLESAHFFAWVRSRSFADTNSLSRVFALPKKAEGYQASI